MSDSTVTLTREQLYDQVWSEPLRSLAKRYGLSDVGLAKTCRRFGIPLPGRGYWAKKTAGHDVKRLSLPAWPQHGPAGRPTINLEPHRSKPTITPGPVIDQTAFEADSANQVMVSQSLRSPHPLVRSAAVRLRASTIRNGEYLYGGREPYLDIQVTQDTLSRALRIMDALLKACERRGWKTSLGSGDDRKTYALVLGQRVPFGIRERLRKVRNEPGSPRRSGMDLYLSYSPEFVAVPSGQLSLVVRESWGHSIRKRWDESEQCPLEGRLNEFLVGLVSHAAEQQELERQRAEHERKRKEDEAQRLAVQRRREEVAARIRRLEQQAVDWSKSRQLTEYLVALTNEASEQPGGIVQGSSFAEWLGWAMNHAARLNPIPQVLSDSASTIAENT